MKILIAIDSFKGSMTSLEAGNAAACGIARRIKDAQIKVMPIADGGEGTVHALVEGLGGSIRKIPVKGPLGKSVLAEYGVVNDTAIIEMAAASGIALLKKEELDPMNTTSYGVGEIIKDAVLHGCRSFIIGVGGSATNDGGVGMLSALGFQFLDAYGNQVPPGAKGLNDIEQIDDANAISELKECKFKIACDVNNPLCGEKGCSRVYGPQKGASEETVEIMDKALLHYAKKTREKYPKASCQQAGAGAAGGLGFAFMAYLNGELESGIELILDKIEIEKQIKDADFVITGEGKIDSQTVMGKAPVGVARVAKKYAKPVIAFAGCVSRDSNVCNRYGIDAIFPIVRTPCTLEEAMSNSNAKKNMADCAEQVANLWMQGRD